MKLYQGIILGTLIFRWLLLFFEWWSIRKPVTDLPPELSDVADPETFKKSQQYTRERSIFSVIRGTFSLVALIIFWFAGGFDALDQWVRSFGRSTITTGLIYVGILALINLILSIPFDVYST